MRKWAKMKGTRSMVMRRVKTEAAENMNKTTAV